MWEITNDIQMNERRGRKGIRMIFLCFKLEIPQREVPRKGGTQLVVQELEDQAGRESRARQGGESGVKVTLI